jgi:uracil-DNA glycosylase
MTSRGTGAASAGTTAIATVDPPWEFARWRACARAALRARIAPEALDWRDGEQGGLLPAADVLALPPVREAPAVPAPFLALAEALVCHRDAARHALPYRLLWRIVGGERALLDHAADADVRRAQEMAQAVRRDAHKMKAFLRFREVPGEPDAFVAWFEPAHDIVDRVAPFFARRFAGMRWAIVTPRRSVWWDGAALAFGAGGVRADAPADDAQDALWKTYYANIFNPARIKLDAMRAEMPRKYWKLMPETTLIPSLVRDAGARVDAMAAREAQATRRRIPAPLPAPPPPAAGTLEALNAGLRACRACELWQPATRAVAGEGPRDARIAIVGEQPGDQEDLAGRPFVGPAGQLFDRALAELGVDRATLYLTNAVKHFRFEQRGKARLHRNPAARHVAACRRWIEEELGLLQPAVVACLGATAAQAMFGRDFQLMAARGRWLDLADGRKGFATVHPSWVLRQPAGEARDAAWRGFVDDLARLFGKVP